MSSDRIRGIVRALAQPVTYLGVAMLVAFYSTLTYLLISDKTHANNDAIRRGGNLVRITDESFSHIFQSVDASILFIRKSYREAPSTFNLSAWVLDPSVRNNLTFDFAIIDANGRIVDASYSRSIIGVDRSHREAFRAQVNATADKLFISHPLKLEATGIWAIDLTRRLTASDGKFGGVIAALIDPHELGKYAGEPDLGRDGSFSLIGLDGTIFMRVINGVVDKSSVGQKLPPTAGTLEHLKQAGSGHFWASPGVFDEVYRHVSYRQLKSFPLIAVVTMPEAEVYRHANENARIYWGIASVLTVTILIAIGVGMRRERKLIDTKEALERGQERYKLVEAAVNDGIWDWNILTGEAYMSPRWKSILGFADDELPNLATSFFDLVHPDDEAAVTEAARASLEDNKTYPSLDIRLRRKDGSYLWVQSRGQILRDAKGRPVRMLGTTTDITRRKQTEALIEENRNNLARAEAMAFLGHYKFENESNKLIWSEGVYRIFGKSPASFTPTLSNALELIYPDDRPTLKQYNLDIIAGIEAPRKTLRATKSDGKMIYVELWSVPVRASDGTVTGMFGTVQDVTERMRTEQALAQSNEILEKRVAERTAELAQEMRQREQAQITLAQAQKMEAIGQLTAGIAHDFNNLLAVVKGSLDFVGEAASRGLTADPELIDAAIRATRRGKELVQRLLAFARQAPLKAEPTALDQMVVDTLRLLQRTLGAGVNIVTRLNASRATVLVDRNQLVNALLNLALNARDAMPNGGHLTIATTCQPAEAGAVEMGEQVCITISDTGDGMTEAVRNRAFEPFFTTKADGLGSGLGLSMVRGFVEQSGGHIDIDSVPGSGTTITIRLPRAASGCQTDESDAVVGSSVTRQEKTVLLVEDDPDVRIVMAAQLKELGYKVRAVTNGTEALDVIVSPADIDITLTDIVLPGELDGIALVKEAMQARPRIGVLCMTGYVPTPSYRKWLEVQNIQLLEKPFSRVRLAQALDDALAK